MDQERETRTGNDTNNDAHVDFKETSEFNKSSNTNNRIKCAGRGSATYAEIRRTGKDAKIPTGDSSTQAEMDKNAHPDMNNIVYAEVMLGDASPIVVEKSAEKKDKPAEVVYAQLDFS